ncbi:MAG: putative toxin-antitoxin system toxin component, PIN family [Opitutaceae bacterium]
MSCIVDTNVLLSGLRSRAGASFRLIERVAAAAAFPSVTVPLVLEYEDVLLRPGATPCLSSKDMGDFIDWWVSVSKTHAVHFLWRPYLRDPKDDMLLEAAMVAGARHIVSFNLRHLEPCKKLGITPISPADYISTIKP